MVVPASVTGGKAYAKVLASGGQAACAVDLARLALRSNAIQTAAGAGAVQPLNFPASIYTQQQVDVMSRLLHLKRSTMQQPRSTSSSSSSSSSSNCRSSSSNTGYTAAPSAAAVAAAAAAAKAAAAEAAAAAKLVDPVLVEQLQDGRISVKGAGKQTVGGRQYWCTRAKTADGVFSKIFATAADAACASDLLQIALHGAGRAAHKLNFPADLYQQQQVAAWGRLLQQWRPGTQLAVWNPQAANAKAAAAEAAAKAAEAAAAAAAAALLAMPETALQLGSGQRKASCVQHTPGSIYGSWRVNFRRRGTVITCYYGSCLEACCAADLARLALYGPMASRLNLPANTYTQQQVAAWQQLMRQQGLSEGLSDDPALAAGLEIELAADAAIAAAAEVAAAAALAEAALFSGEQPPPRGSWVCYAKGRWTFALQGSITQGLKRYRKYLANGVQAACAADLARLATQGHTPAAAAALNFPVSTYTQQQVAAMAALLQLKRPGLTLAGCQAGSTSSSSVLQVDAGGSEFSDSSSSSSSSSGPESAPHTPRLTRSAAYVTQQVCVRAAADGAVADAAAALADTQEATRFSSVPSAPPYGKCVDLVDNKFRMNIKHPGAKPLARSYSSRLAAAAAADLAQLALGRAAGNLPGDAYSAAQVAAMRQLMQFERPGWFDSAALSSQQLQLLRAAARSAAAAAATAAAQAAPEQAAAYASNQQLPPYCRVKGPSWIASAFIPGSPQRISLACPDAVAAACAADLAHLAMHRDPSRPQPKLNFAPDIYSSQQVEAFGALLAATYPGAKLSAAGAGGSNSSSSSSSDGDEATVAQPAAGEEQLHLAQPNSPATATATRSSQAAELEAQLLRDGAREAVIAAAAAAAAQAAPEQAAAYRAQGQQLQPLQLHGCRKIGSSWTARVDVARSAPR
jgi:hypothetical protein